MCTGINEIRPNQGKSKAVEVWFDLEGYFWSLENIDMTETGKNNELSISPVLNDVFSSKPSLHHKTGFTIKLSCKLRHLLYFNVEGEHPLWKMFIEGRGQYNNRKEMFFEDGVTVIRKEVGKFFRNVRSTFQIIDEVDNCQHVEKEV